MKKLPFLLLFTVLVTVQVNAQKWKTISLDAFSIKYPGDWSTDTSKSMGADLLMYTEAAAGDGFTENINVLIQDLAGYNLDIDKYTEISEEQIKTMIQGGKILSSERVTAGAMPYHRIIYLGEQNGRKLQFLQHYYIKDEKAYILTLTCERNQFKKYLSIADAIFKSFRFK